jgi:adenylate cyclase
LNLLGVAYQLTGRPAEAIAAQKQALVHNPNYQYAYTYLAFSYVLQWAWQLSQDPQTLEQALAAAQQAIAVDDSFPWAHTALGSVYLWQKQHKQALTEAERAIALDPNLAEGYATLAGILNAVGKPEEAIGVAEKAVRLFPNPLYLFELGHAYCLSGRYEEAITTLKQLISRYPNRLDIHLMLAAVYSELGQAAEARAEAAEVLRLNPKFSLEIHKQRSPIKDPAVLERHLAALRKAGLK